ncbi:MAG: hypothetical protein IPN34_23600 [Planctomycetes bacterium]|nr:hypothetical protein [Planctomycetota bacterium]
MRTPSVLLGALTLLTAQSVAQQPCGRDNLYPIILTNAQGVPADTSTIDPASGERLALFDGKDVYMSFAGLPSGFVYNLYVHVTDRVNGVLDQVLSANDPADRFVRVDRTGATIDITLPFTNGANPNTIVTLPSGDEILLISPVNSAAHEPCLFKAWMGDCIDTAGVPNSPYLLQGTNATRCCVRSYQYFRIGDATPGSDVKGNVFEDLDRSGSRNPGEGPLAGWEVRLVTPTSTTSVLTDANGVYCFPNVTAGNYTIELVLQSGYDATCPTVATIEVCGCANQTGADFCAARIQRGCEGRTIGFWRNRNGTALITQYGILPTLNGLCLADATGTMANPPATLSSWGAWLQGANARNMAYMLSAQLAGMHCNVLAGNVDANCVVNGGSLGNLTIAELMRRAVDALCADGYTPSGDPNRALQGALKDALDAANNNTNWL